MSDYKIEKVIVEPPMLVLSAEQAKKVEKEFRILESRYLIWGRLSVESLTVFGEELRASRMS